MGGSGQISGKSRIVVVDVVVVVIGRPARTFALGPGPGPRSKHDRSMFTPDHDDDHDDDHA
jgi:hypothetical protein